MVLILVLSLAILCTVGLLMSQHALNVGPILILGTGPMTGKLMEEVNSSSDGCQVAGLVDHQRPTTGPARALPWLGTFDRLSEIVERLHPSRIVVALADRRGRLPLVSLLESKIRGVVVEDALEFYEHLTGKIAIEAMTPGTLILSKGFKHEGFGQVVARAVSLGVAMLGLIVLAPLLVAVAIAIKLDSRGPVFFTQERAGRGGLPFNLLKFRTMHPSDTHRSEWVQDNTDRITRVGGWLRRFRLDEVPQMVNVLRGEMNLVGPRPHPTSNQKIFMEHIAYYGLRSTVRPGVTGWAQVRYGYANNLEQETEKMRYDLYYIKNHSLGLDMQIMVETVYIMVAGSGAAEVRIPASSERAVAWPATVAAAPAVEVVGMSRQ